MGSQPSKGSQWLCLLVVTLCVIVGVCEGEGRCITSGISSQKIMSPPSCSPSLLHHPSWEKPYREQRSGEALAELTAPTNSL